MTDCLLVAMIVGSPFVAALIYLVWDPSWRQRDIFRLLWPASKTEKFENDGGG